MDEELIKNSLYGISYALECPIHSNLYAEKVIKSGVLTHYMDKCFGKDLQILITNTIFPFLGVVGNISCAFNGRFTDYLIKIKAVDIAFGCVDEFHGKGFTSSNAIFERALWVLSNIVCDSSNNSLYLSSTPTVSKLFAIAKRTGLCTNIGFEILNYFCSSIHSDEPAICLSYYHHGIIEICYKFLASANIRLIDIACECLRTLVSHGFLFMVEGVHEKNFFLDKFITIGGVDLISDLLLKMKVNQNETYKILLQLEKWCKSYLSSNDESRDNIMR